MSALNEVTDYLLKKIHKINLNNQKSNTGGVLVKTYSGWEDVLERMVVTTFQTIQSQFVRNNTTYTVGECGLTYVSMAIGDRTAHMVSREPIKTAHQLALGDLLIEGFLYHGFAEIIPPKRRNETYVLKAAPKWTELADITDEQIEMTIIGSTTTPPKKPNCSIHKMHEHLFKEDAAYVKGLDKLQQVQWCINRRVLDTILTNHKKFVSEDTIDDNDAKEQRRRSKVIEWKFITRKAEVLKDYESFYQYFDVDYRGRMYNVEPFLNYQGNDLAKGLLCFNEPKEINDSGRFWLAVHTACSYNQSYNKDEIPEWCEEDYAAHLDHEELEDISVDKMTLNDRANWTINNMDKILQWAADDELQMKAEKPVVFLACCYEWDLVEKIGLTCLPVAIDGSNNGWQHLGAISKDVQTGELVGLVPSIIQKDFYVQTAKELKTLATDDRLRSILKAMPMKHVRKGISKRGSMTRAYSAGAQKIAENMFFDCKTEDYHERYGITLGDCNKFARLLIKAIENVCPGPLKTMKYLQDLAVFQLGKHVIRGPGSPKEFKEMRSKRQELMKTKELTDEELNELNDLSTTLQEFSYELVYGQGEDSMTWETPSGFTALYEKYTMSDFKLRSTLNGKQIKHVLKAPTDKPDVHGFMCGISPNYIHSMDAAHMALLLAEWEGDFGAVHDSFSTHACDVDDLLEKTKEVFINMYNYDNYFDIIRDNLTNNEDDVEQPILGTLNIGDINGSEYFFA